MSIVSSDPATAKKADKLRAVVNWSLPANELVAAQAGRGGLTATASEASQVRGLTGASQVRGLTGASQVRGLTGASQV